MRFLYVLGLLVWWGIPAASAQQHSYPVPAPDTNGSTTITTGGTFQQLAGPQSNRLSLDFQNKSGNGDACYLFFGVNASATTAKSIKIADGQEYLRSSGGIPSAAIQATCTTTGDAVYFDSQP